MRFQGRVPTALAAALPEVDLLELRVLAGPDAMLRLVANVARAQSYDDAKATLEGSLRGVLATLTPEQLAYNRSGTRFTINVAKPAAGQ